jgi:hypothetical protein
MSPIAGLCTIENIAMHQRRDGRVTVKSTRFDIKLIDKVNFKNVGTLR